MSLSDWVENHWLIPHQATAGEIRDLLDVVDRDLRAAATPGIHTDWRLSIAWNAALQAAVAALAAAGFRAEHGGHHFRVIQSLALTIGLKPETIQRLDRFRKKRNVGDYEKAGLATDLEADEMLALARDLRERVREWLRVNHPELLREQSDG